ncbi:hypothetical protein WGH24286_00023 [Periweissella ghanensis]|uniref:Uncharacterized protein n=1 Tax=Periweissella ghanensis TaxID=467997 RepID=A0ABM8Z852_9LACO|nr:hypothetical protein WGH24286_00023 [Periweissella ghanensis]
MKTTIKENNQIKKIIKALQENLHEPHYTGGRYC